MIIRLWQWFILRKTNRLYQLLVCQPSASFEEMFQKRVTYLAHMMTLQFKQKVTVSYEDRRVFLRRGGSLIVEIMVYRKGGARIPTYLMIRSGLKPLPNWWLHLAFSGMKWNVSTFPVTLQLTYEKPHGP